MKRTIVVRDQAELLQLVRVSKPGTRFLLDESTPKNVPKDLKEWYQQKEDAELDFTEGMQ